ncbi:hypothetical protein NC651_021204 [Populus alba x Populus x berolinensis]|nr:hypothetical protein NC651_021204 [Populus alba x Populus x berolinensis]
MHLLYQVVQAEKWKPPNHGQIRFDCDVSKLQGCSLTGLALVGRNHRGQVFVGKA